MHVAHQMEDPRHRYGTLTRWLAFVHQHRPEELQAFEKIFRVHLDVLHVHSLPVLFLPVEVAKMPCPTMEGVRAAGWSLRTRSGQVLAILIKSRSRASSGRASVGKRLANPASGGACCIIATMFFRVWRRCQSAARPRARGSRLVDRDRDGTAPET